MHSLLNSPVWNPCREIEIRNLNVDSGRVEAPVNPIGEDDQPGCGCPCDSGKEAVEIGHDGLSFGFSISIPRLAKHAHSATHADANYGTNDLEEQAYAPPNAERLVGGVLLVPSTPSFAKIRSQDNCREAGG
jgi:hypothetical protein